MGVVYGAHKCVCVHMHYTCFLLPGNQILVSKYLATRRVMVSEGLSDGNGIQKIHVVILPDTGALNNASSAPSVWECNYYMYVCAH